jgi:HK97 family phage prohead protease
MEKIIKVFNGEIKEVKGNTVTVYVSTPAVDRDKEVILPTAWNLKNYEKHPVLLSSHKYDKLTNQIGKAIASGTDDKGLWMTFEYFTGKGNFEADWGYFLAKQGIASYSVGFIPNKAKEGTNGVRKVYEDVELLEVSQVLVPANPEAVQGDSYEKQYLMAIKSFGEANKSEMGIDDDFSSTSYSEVVETEIKGVIPYKKHPLAPESATWDAGKEVKEATPEQLKEMCAWYDSSKPDIKSSYKLPHHYVKNYVTVWKGVAAAMAALLGARGGVAIPDKDRKGVYNHLAKHYQEFNKKVPEFKEYESDEEIFKACGITEKEFDAVMAKKVDAEVDTKSGRVISEANRKKIQNAIEALKSAESALSELLQMSEPVQNSSPVDEKKQGKDVLSVLKELEQALAV